LLDSLIDGDGALAAGFMRTKKKAWLPPTTNDPTPPT